MITIDEVREVHNRRKNELRRKGGVVGTAIGRKSKNGKVTADLCIVCFVKEKKPKAELEKRNIVPKTVNGIKTDVVQSGEIVIQQNSKERHRPAPGGVSCGHYNITAGTLGIWLKRYGVWHILSNNHVLANSNDAKINDNIIQPGTYDGGINNKDLIATLTEFVEIDWVGDNLVDAAIAHWAESDNGDSTCSFASVITKSANAISKALRRKTYLKALKVQGVDDVVDHNILHIGRPINLLYADIGQEVKKSGRTTGLTFGEILYVDAEVNVNYGAGKTAHFVDQLITGNMSDGGDSGSVVVTDDGLYIVGLLFAGSSDVTVINRIQNVFNLIPGLEL